MDAQEFNKFLREHADEADNAVAIFFDAHEPAPEPPFALRKNVFAYAESATPKDKKPLKLETIIRLVRGPGGWQHASKKFAFCTTLELLADHAKHFTDNLGYEIDIVSPQGLPDLEALFVGRSGLVIAIAL